MKKRLAYLSMILTILVTLVAPIRIAINAESQSNSNDSPLVQINESKKDTILPESGEEGFFVKKYIDKFDDNTIEITMEAWEKQPDKVEIPAHDIVIVLDQSAASNRHRKSTLGEAKKFIERLNTPYDPVDKPYGLKSTEEGKDHRISIVGYGRIKYEGKEYGKTEVKLGGKKFEGIEDGKDIASKNYNTGYYNNVGTFISKDMEWTEAKFEENIDGNTVIVEDDLPELTKRDYSDAFMSPKKALNIIDDENDQTISKWNSGAARLDAGLVLMNKILTTSTTDREKMGLIFSNTVATQNYQGDVRIRVKAVEKAVTQLNASHKNLTLLSAGQYVELHGVADDNIENYEGQMNAMTLDKGSSVAPKDAPGSFTFDLKLDTASLFQRMGEIINPASSSITIKDIINSPFKLNGDLIEAYTVPFEKYENSKPYFGDVKTEIENHKIDLNEEKNEISLKLDNLVPIPVFATEKVRGEKLVVQVRVNLKEEFLGGNQIPTNSSDSGVYQGEAQKFVMRFPEPSVDVSIRDINMDPIVMNVYQGANIDHKSLNEKINAKIGDVPIDLNTENYGLEDWQKQYIEINHTLNDNKQLEFEFLDEDQPIQQKITVEPKDKGKFEKKETEKPGNIYVFKPKLNYENAYVYYGSDKITINGKSLSITGNKFFEDYIKSEENLSWENMGNGKTIIDNDNSVTMDSTKPELNYKYKLDGEEIGSLETLLDDNKYNKKEVSKIDVELSLLESAGDKITSGSFEIISETVSLKVTKEGGVDDEPHIFNIKKDGEDYTQLTITGNDTETIYELPVGKYTIEEDTKWNWRSQPSYEAKKINNINDTIESFENEKEMTLNPIIIEYSDKKITKIKGYNQAEFTVTNELKDVKWLNGFSSVWKNVFGKEQLEIVK